MRLPDVLTGLAPANPATCPRCGCGTVGLANGRGRVDICGRCGTLEMATPEGLEMYRLKAEKPAGLASRP